MYEIRYLQNTTFDHDFHTICGDASDGIYRLFEDCWWKIGVQLKVIGLSGMFDMYINGSHRRLMVEQGIDLSNGEDTVVVSAKGTQHKETRFTILKGTQITHRDASPSRGGSVYLRIVNT